MAPPDRAITSLTSGTGARRPVDRAQVGHLVGRITVVGPIALAAGAMLPVKQPRDELRSSTTRSPAKGWAAAWLEESCRGDGIATAMVKFDPVHNHPLGT